MTDSSFHPISVFVSKVSGGVNFVNVCICQTGSQDSVISRETSYGLDGPGFESQKG